MKKITLVVAMVGAALAAGGMRRWLGHGGSAGEHDHAGHDPADHAQVPPGGAPAPSVEPGGAPAPGTGIACEKANIVIRFASADVARAAGIETTEASDRTVSPRVEALGRVAFDANRSARVSSRVPGILREVRCDLGRDVAAGDVLFVVDSDAVGEAQSEYLEARAAERLARLTVEAERSLSQRSATSPRTLQESEAAHAQALARMAHTSQHLRTLGFGDEDLARLDRDGEVCTLLPVVSPVSGTVVARDGAVGEALDPARPVLEVADLDRVWVLVDLFEAQAGEVRPGQTAIFTADATPGRSLEGTVEWISARIDPETRTLPARLSVTNPGRILRENLFGRVRIRTRDSAQVLTIPKGAVQWEGCHHVVFVPDGEGVYRTRGVELGFEGEGFYEVVRGLAAGERVVTTGSFLLKTEILKTSIGAG